jgi:anthranilate phosphoribosyltransferase
LKEFHSADRVAVVEKPAPEWFGQVMTVLADRRPLTSAQVRCVMHDLMLGGCGDIETAALLVAWHIRGETAEELAAAAAVLREHMVRFESGRADVLDTCGTGGDACNTFNISTATALVAAGAGVPVVKHGNRAVSSRSGSADVLSALGVAFSDDQDWAARCLQRAGLAFCFAPHFHPALRHVAAVRRRLRMRTVFNCLGPLANPASAPYQLLGVGRRGLLDPMAGALAMLGSRRAFVVTSDDGLDEVSLTAPTHVREVRDHAVSARIWTPADFGLAPCTLLDLAASSPEESAAIIRGIIDGREGPPTRVVLANTAAALLAAEKVDTLHAGVDRARDSVVSGRARRVLDELIESSGPI